MSVTRPALLCATMVTLLCSVLRAEHVRNDFPYESKTVQVHGANMHYADSEGSGHPVVFVHGIPTWSYLWRNVLPHVEDRGRLIAVDLIGFGKSEKPKINYSLVEHARYFEGFVEALELDEFTLVVHDMGSFVGLHYAMKHPEKVKGIAMMESMLSLDTWESMPPEASEFMKAMRIRENAFDFSVVQNASVEQLIPMLIKRKLSDHEMAAYRMPFPTRESREPLVPLWMDFPISGQPVVPHEIQATYLEKMQSSQIPKLLLTVDEPSVGTPHQVEWVRANVPNTKIISIGAARHFMQEDQPEAIGKAINDWMLANRL